MDYTNTITLWVIVVQEDELILYFEILNIITPLIIK